MAQTKRPVSAANGRFGDTEVLHVNPQEKSFVVPLLKSLGGAGTVNPIDGGLEFYSDSSNEHGAKNDNNGSNAGNKGNSSGGGGQKAGGIKADTSTQFGAGMSTGDVGNPEGTGTDPNSGKSNARSVGPAGRPDRTQGGGGGNPDPRSSLNNPLGKAQAIKDRLDMMDADYNDQMGESTMDKIGNMIGRAFGVSESAPTAAQAAADMNSSPSTEGQPGTIGAHWGVNPAQIAGTAASLALGIPGLGTAAGAVYSALGGDNIDLGPDPLGGSGKPNSGTPSADHQGNDGIHDTASIPNPVDNKVTSTGSTQSSGSAVSTGATSTTLAQANPPLTGVPVDKSNEQRRRRGSGLLNIGGFAI